MPRVKLSKPKRSSAQKAHIEALNRSQKENIPPENKQPGAIVPKIQDPELLKVKKQLANTQRQTRRLRTKISALQEKTTCVSSQLQEAHHSIAVITAKAAESDLCMRRRVTKLEDKLQVVLQSRSHQIADVKALKQQLKRAATAQAKVVHKFKSVQPTLNRLKNGKRGAYSVDARKMARLLVLNGCARSKVGMVLSSLATEFGAKLKRSMSRRTAGRVMLEGQVASQMQIGREVGDTEVLTTSVDGTSNRGVTFEAQHIAMRVPDYRAGSKTVDARSTPKLRLLRVNSMCDQSADAAVKGLLENVSGTLDVFNRSPMAACLQKNVTVRDFLRALKGMNTDHASKEKSAANGILQIKHKSSLDELGEAAMVRMTTLGTLAQYLSAWNQYKIAKHGGMDKWNALTVLDQSKADRAMMEEIRRKLGEAEYKSLPDKDRRLLDLFIWAGCCMHKDQNSFQAGNAAMMLAWGLLSIAPPVLLANKANAAVLCQILEPGTNQSRTMSEDETRAFEQSTRGGVKVAALAGAIFRNKDDKKGQGDRHSDHFKTKVDARYTRFPDTSNTRFGSHGEAATDLIQYLDEHIRFLEVVRLSKKSATFTQIEFNVLSALKDSATLTELCAMALYHQAVSKPYMVAVRGDSSVNVLDLGPLHVMVREFVESVVNKPDLLLGDLAHPTSHVEGTLDGRPWDNPKAIHAISNLLPSLPHGVILRSLLYDPIKLGKKGGIPA